MTVPKALRALLALAAALILAWATIDVAARATDDPADGRKTLLRILYWGSIEENQIVRSMVADFEAEHPDIKVQPIHSTRFPQKLRTMLAAGDAPDLFYLPLEQRKRLVEAGVIEPLDPHLEPLGGPPTDDHPLLAGYYANLLDAYRLPDEQGEVRLWGLPKDFTTVGMYINLDLFEEAGVEVPYDGWTWDELEEAARKITALRGPGRDRLYGVHLNDWNSIFRLIATSFGGSLYEFDADGRPDFEKPTFDSPAVLEALEFLRRLRLDDGIAFNSTGLGRDAGNEFLTGNIGIIGPLGRWMTPTYRSAPDLRFDFVPLPHKAGVPETGFTATVAWAISRDSPHKDEAFELLRFLTGPEGATRTAQLGLAIPALRDIAESDAFLNPDQMPANSRLFLDVIPHSPFNDEPEIGEVYQHLAAAVSASAQMGNEEPAQAMREAETAWLAEINSPLVRNDYPRVPWTPILLTAGAAIVAGLGVLVWMARRERLGALDAAQERAGFLFISPWVLGFALLTIGPMVLSLILAFTRWSAMEPISSAQFVGLDNFRQLLFHDETIVKSLQVTAYYVVLAVPITQVAALAVAVLMSVAVRGIEVFRTIYFLPSVITGVAMGTLWLALFNNDWGLINQALSPIVGWFGGEPPDWFGKDAGRWAIPAFVLMSVWGVGGAMVIYLAGLKNIPSSLYEAATVDGSGPWRKFWNITLPMLSPLVFFNLVMGIIGSFQVFTQAYVMTGRGPDDSTLFYVLNLYYQAFESHRMGYASAMAWVLFLIVLALTLLVFRASKNAVHYEGLR